MRPLLTWQPPGYLPLLIVSFLLRLTAVLGGKRLDHLYPRPRFLPGDSYFNYTRGDTAHLRCNIADLGTKTVTWRRAASLNPLTIGDMTFTEDKDYEVLHRGQNNWDLLIKNVQMRHAGTYECQISTKNKMKRIVQLVVEDKEKRKKQPNISITGQFYIDKGQDIKLRCNATGETTPPDAIDWFKDGNKLQSDHYSRVSIKKQYSVTAKTMTSVLEIKNAQMTHTGTYTCRTTDLQVTSKKVNILNAEKPKKKRNDEEKPLATQIKDGNKNGKGTLHERNELVIVIATVTTLITLLYTSIGFPS